MNAELKCTHCGKSAPANKWMPIEPYWDGRELRELIGWSASRWNAHWRGVWPKFYQYKHAEGTRKPTLVRVFPASQIKPFMESDVWLKPPRKNRRVK